jgi:hypothetical protein
MKKVLIICPTQREYRDLPSIAAALGYELIFEEFGGDYFDNPLAQPCSAGARHLDILSLIEDLINRYRGAGLAGVTSAVGYPGMSVSSIVAERLGRFKLAASCVLRTFENRRVLSVPTREQLCKLFERFPDARFEICASTGKLLSDEMQDGKSYPTPSLTSALIRKQTSQPNLRFAGAF